MSSIEKLLDIMSRLRDEQHGCPWDCEQTFATIAPYTVEEAYEVADAIAREDMTGLRSELGDLLFQVVFHARMAEEQGAFDFDDVVESICDKLWRRHPHVFRNGEIDGVLAGDFVIHGLGPGSYRVLSLRVTLTPVPSSSWRSFIS